MENSGTSIPSSRTAPATRGRFRCCYRSFSVSDVQPKHSRLATFDDAAVSSIRVDDKASKHDCRSRNRTSEGHTKQTSAERYQSFVSLEEQSAPLATAHGSHRVWRQSDGVRSVSPLRRPRKYLQYQLLSRSRDGVWPHIRGGQLVG